MNTLVQALIGLSGLAFVMAVVSNFAGNILTSSEGWSRAATNLTLIAIALVLYVRGGSVAGRP